MGADIHANLVYPGVSDQQAAREVQLCDSNVAGDGSIRGQSIILRGRMVANSAPFRLYQGPVSLRVVNKADVLEVGPECKFARVVDIIRVKDFNVEVPLWLRLASVCPLSRGHVRDHSPEPWSIERS